MEEVREMMSMKVAVEHAIDAVHKGDIDRSDANVLVVQLMGVRIVSGPIPRQVRNELMAGVKAGKIGHLKKEGLKPEAFFHKNAKADAMYTRAKIAGESIDVLQKVFAPATDKDYLTVRSLTDQQARSLQ